MYSYTRRAPAPRLNYFYSTKQRVLGNSQVPPAWRVPTPAANAAQGSKILLSRLPLDVDQREVEELFRKTVGPLKDAFVIYNSQGKSKGMAIVEFQRPGDAALARTKYHGKMVDGRRPIRIEIVSDTESLNSPPQHNSLFDRLGVPSPAPAPAPAPTSAPQQFPNHMLPRQAAALAKTAPTPSTALPVATGPRRRYKKGPKRVQKRMERVRVTREQLDKEMEDYRALVIDS